MTRYAPRDEFRWRVAGILLIAFMASAAGTGHAIGSERSPRLSLPIDCRIGETCFVQNYVDADPGQGATDYACGSATYDGHKGTDFRVVSAAASEGVGVLAAADGMVLRGRDSMPDRLIRDYESKTRLRSVVGANMCGNGLIIDHGEGWTTQYCHLKRGSIAVQPGDIVKAGDRIGTVGYSGMADFAHVHLTVRHNKTVIDPFSGRSMAEGAKCSGPAGESTSSEDKQGLWKEGLRGALTYGRNAIIGAGFAGSPPKNDQLERDHRVSEPRSDSPAFLVYVRMINLRAGDRIQIQMQGPGGFNVDTTTQPLKRNKAAQLVFAGKKRKTASWQKGLYRADISILRPSAGGSASSVVAKRELDFDLR